MANYRLISPALTHALETAKDMRWNYCLLSDRGWSGRYAAVLNAGVNGVYLPGLILMSLLTMMVIRLNPLMAQLTGNVAGVIKLFNRCGWQAASAHDTSLPHQFTLMVRQGG